MNAPPFACVFASSVISECGAELHYLAANKLHNKATRRVSARERMTQLTEFISGFSYKHTRTHTCS